MMFCLLSGFCWKENITVLKTICRAEDLLCRNEYHLFMKVGGSKPDSLGEEELLRRKFSSLVFLAEV